MIFYTNGKPLIVKIQSFFCIQSLRKMRVLKIKSGDKILKSITTNNKKR